MPIGKSIPPEESIGRLRPAADAAQPEAQESPLVKTNGNNPSPSFVEREPRRCLSDLVLPQSVLAALDVLKSRLRNHDLIYRQWDFQSVDPGGMSAAINFYGPPGTGKTMCAEALAHELGKPIIEVSYAEIESKYVGDTPKNIVAAFDCARRAEALLFFDEADSILGRRLTSVTQSADHGVNVSRAVMLKQLDAFAGVVVFATNLARNIDGAFVRRILQHVEVPLPDEACRRRLWDRMVRPAVPGRADLDFMVLATESEGLSGGMIKNATLIALAKVAQEPAVTRKLQQSDLREAIMAVKAAQHAVGDGPAQSFGRELLLERV